VASTSSLTITRSNLVQGYRVSLHRSPPASVLKALGKVRAGYRPDITHPCVDYTGNWVEMGVVEPWDPSLITNFKDLDPVLVKGGQIDGQQYFIPADWGFSSPLYRSDKVEPNGEESWELFYDDRYKGKISWWDSPLENFVIWGYVNGVDDPWSMSDEELARKLASGLRGGTGTPPARPAAPSWRGSGPGRPARPGG
jgi:spermidine/putrescine-binding protein